MSIDELLKAYLAERLLRPATAKHCRLVVRLFKRDTGIADLHQVQKMDLLRWRTQVLERSSAATWNNYLRHLRALGNYGWEEELLERNPFAAVKLVPTYHKPKKTVALDTLRQANAYLAQSDEPLKPAWFWRIVLQTLYTTGMRRRQLVTIRWSDIDFQAERLLLRAEGSKTRRAWHIALLPETLDGLRDLRRRTVAVIGNSELGDHQAFNVTLFYARYTGEEMTEEQLSGFFRRLAAGIGQRISTHRLRHTFASQLAPSGDLKTLQDLLGHTNIRTTLEYVEPDLEQMRALLKRLPQVRNE